MGSLPDTYKEKIMKQAREMGYNDAADFDTGSKDGSNEGEENHEKENQMITDLLESDDQEEEKRAQDMMRKIEEECSIEARRDEQLL